jgi:hypothetical protein
MDIFRACRSNSVTVESLEVFKKEDFIKKSTYNDCIALSYLCKNECITLNTLKYYINKIDNIEYIFELNDSATTLLMDLCNNKSVDFDMLKYFIDLVSDRISYITHIDYSQGTNYNALHYLCENKNITLDKLKCLLESIKSDDLRNDFIITPSKLGYTTLMLLCLNPNVTPNMVKYLISNIDERDKSRFMICRTANVDSETFLYMLFYKNNIIDERHIAIMKYLIGEISPRYRNYLINGIIHRQKNKNTLICICETVNLDISLKLQIINYLKQYLTYTELIKNIKIINGIYYMLGKENILDEFNNEISFIESIEHIEKINYSQ